ncbi:MAG: transglutaminase domain-containing protein [Lachnospiraceae bacterium]|nr:transglutaminase domain-containing protein [Lachnospiraceae bacterium]
MSKIEKIIWNNSMNYNLKTGNRKEIIGHAISQIIIDAVCVLLFVTAARFILMDLYSWAEFDAMGFFVMVLMVVIVSAVLEISYYLSRVKCNLLCLAVMATGIVSVVLYLFVYDHLYEVVSGILKIAEYYINDWNDYYGTNYIVEDGSFSAVASTINFLTLVLAFLFLCIAKISGKNMVTVLVPIAALIMEFIVSLSPDIMGLVLMFVGVLVANASSWKVQDFKQISVNGEIKKKTIRQYVWVLVGAIALVSSFGVKLVGENQASKLTDYSQEVRYFHLNLTDMISDLTLWELIPGLGTSDTEKITNDAPVYQNVEMLSVEMDNRPYGNVYLKGYSVGNYEDGEWTYDEKSFKNACKDAGYDYETVKEELNFLPVSKALDGYDAESLTDTSYGEYIKIEYVNSVGTRAYFPYFAEIDDDKIYPEGDACLSKKRSLKEIEFWVWYFADQFEAKIFMLNSGDELEWEDWYNDFVMKQYLRISSDVPSAGKIAEELYMEGDDEFDGMKVSTKNYNRMSKAYRVAQWMEKNTKYNINLKSIDDDTDPIEYFLSKSKKGYCTHYASAATLILREMGVPARMVTGYMVPNSTFTYDDDRYVATVMDNMSHAWVEIYLEGIGWVPVEVTEGYVEKAWDSDFKRPIVDEDEKETETSEKETQSETRPDATQPSTTKPQESSTTKPAEKETEEQTTTKMEEETTTSAVTSNKADSSNKFLIYVIIAIVLVVVIAATIVIIYIVRDKAEKNLLEQKRQKKTLNVIKLINRKIYKKLRFTGKVSKSLITDLEYEEILKENYIDISKEDWDKYMKIVKASAFSNNNFTEEEMNFCYEIYCKIIKDGNNSQ